MKVSDFWRSYGSGTNQKVSWAGVGCPFTVQISTEPKEGKGGFLWSEVARGLIVPELLKTYIRVRRVRERGGQFYDSISLNPPLFSLQLCIV